MNIRICTPVIGHNKEEFIKNLIKTQEISDFIELRVDSLGTITEEDFFQIKKQVTKKAIFTCRSAEEGGKFTASETNRIHLLQQAIGVFDFVDIEFMTMQTHAFTRHEKTKIILSYHNFESTPNYWELQKIIYRMNQLHPDIIKIATMVEKEYEVTKLYRLLTNKPHTEERIVVGMGESGKMTRILGPLLGGYLTYASTPFGATAAGQIDAAELQVVLKKICYGF